MKITQIRLKQIIQEELAAVAAEGWKHAQDDMSDMAASREVDILKTSEDVLHLSSYAETEDERNVLQQAAEILKNYSGVLEEGELEESWGEPLNKPLRKPDLKTKSGAGGSGRGGATHQATYAANPDRKYGGRGYEE
jgi:hypothetical protein